MFGEVLTGSALTRGDGRPAASRRRPRPVVDEPRPRDRARLRRRARRRGLGARRAVARGRRAPAGRSARLPDDPEPADADPGGDRGGAEPVLRALTKFELLMTPVIVHQAARIRSLLRRELAAPSSSCDMLAWPTVPAPAPPIENPTVELPSGRAPADPGNLRQTGLRQPHRHPGDLGARRAALERPADGAPATGAVGRGGAPLRRGGAPRGGDRPRVRGRGAAGAGGSDSRS